MSKKQNLITVLITMMSLFGFAQNLENSKWYFGEYAALDFETGSPQPMTNSAMHAHNGTSSVADQNGELLFYSNGKEIWNKNHEIMPGGVFDCPCSFATKQRSVIVASPVNNNIYYVFRLRGYPSSSFDSGLDYKIVDMTGNGGLGSAGTEIDLITVEDIGNVSILSHKMTSTLHADGDKAWLVTQVKDKFYAYLINEFGVQPPVISNVPSAGNHHPVSAPVNGRGVMKVSPNGEKLAVSYAYVGVHLYDFDNQTGAVNNLNILYDATSTYHQFSGLEFSPNSEQLYFTRSNELFQLEAEEPISSTKSIKKPLVKTSFLLGQFDLNERNNKAINNYNPIYLGTTMYDNGLQIALDGKIYMTNMNNNYLSVINTPNAEGLACNFQPQGVILPSPSIVKGGLPQTVPVYNSCNWLKAIGTNNNPANNEYVISTAIDSNGDVFALGYTSPNTNIEGTTLMGNTYIVKYDSCGEKIWVKDVSFLKRPHSMEINNNNELIIMSGYDDTDGQIVSYYLSKLSHSGNLIWQNTLEYAYVPNSSIAISGFNPLGGITKGVAMDLKKSNGDIFVAASIEGGLQLSGAAGFQVFNAGSSHLKTTIIRFNTYGHKVWSTTMSGETNLYLNGFTVSENSPEIFVSSSGRTSGGCSVPNCYDIKVNQYEQNNNFSFTLPDNGYLIDYSPFLVKFSYSPYHVWVTDYKSCDWKVSSTNKFFGNLVYNENVDKLFVSGVKFDADDYQNQKIAVVNASDLELVNDFHSTAGDHLLGKMKAEGDYVYVAGTYLNYGRFLALKMDQNGLVWTYTSENSLSKGLSLVVNDGFVYVSGQFNYQDIDLGAPNNDIIPHNGGSYDGFITRLWDQGQNGISDGRLYEEEGFVTKELFNEKEKSLFILKPNPVSTTFKIETNKNARKKATHFEIFDVNGFLRKKKTSIKNTNSTYNVSNLNPGIYFVKIYDGMILLETKHLVVK